MAMDLHEECGVFGVISPERADVADMAYYGLYALQHRGQESCGIVINDDGLFYSYKDMGLVSEVFSPDALSRLPRGNMAVGHVRYGTTGGTNRANCQPIEVNHQKGKMALAHNGNISNAAQLRDQLELSGAIFHTTSDTEIIAYIVTRERLKTPSIEDALSSAMYTLDGAYSLVLMSAQKLICARDPYGFRPLCFGKTPEGMYVAASESCALKALGAEFVRDLEPGEILVFGPEGMKSRREHCGRKQKKLCIFEYIYFARPDSVIDGVSVHGARVKAGRILARKHPARADIVVGVPDSGLDAALGFSMESGIPYGIGLIKNKYIGRTFISPGQNARLDQVKIKLSAIEESVKGKRVVLIDDSIVRGTTSGRIVRLLREAGAKEIHMRISSPPFLHPCYYGTDIDSREHLIACHHSVSETAGIIGADSLGYLPVSELDALIGREEKLENSREGLLGGCGARIREGRAVCENRGFCSACFDGDYPTEVPSDTRKNRFEQRLSERKALQLKEN
jgi:amidophosphoribosyltransferase